MPIKTEKPLRQDAERNRQRILTAATELFAERGLDVTLNDIAHHAGVGVGTVYRRYPDKANLVEELFETKMAHVVSLLRDALEDPDPWHGLVQFLESSLEFQASDRALRQILTGSDQGVERVSRIRRQMFPLGRQLVARAVEAGRLRADFQPTDLPLLLLMITSVIDVSRQAQPELWRRYLGIVLDGLKPRSDGNIELSFPALQLELVDAVMSQWKPR